MGSYICAHRPTWAKISFDDKILSHALISYNNSNAWKNEDDCLIKVTQFNSTGHHNTIKLTSNQIFQHFSKQFILYAIKGPYETAVYDRFCIDVNVDFKWKS